MIRRGRCKVCRRAISANGAQVVVVAVRDGEDVYACAEHRSTLAGPPGDPVVHIAQYQDMARRRFRP